VNLKWQEVAVSLLIVMGLMVCKHVPFFAGLPVTEVTGIACFSAAIFFAYRLMQIDLAERA
jgi:hypothetical protein